ncbi:hypothetical protein CAPTEDRAFT_224259 [Capitella teleta]|uniref:Uncharacterized protein n=1 Tax=Capitella teleta TaxID=283909 RepID=R7UX73_CAPTE|nr:hypothetical protein CAPTEDRAFT_224259 [Capitella teleta]|eukprot:ELU11163.1 hypothetical protein CAPTEDRAFT_224259 [Capitella teleta]
MWRVLVTVIVSLFCGVEGHGRLLRPPSRSSMWRLPEHRGAPINYNDNELNCGGFYNQWSRQGGRCGVCGDPWQGPRRNEPGGEYYTGVITADYTSGETIDVQVEITANHLGYFEFRLCTDAENFNGMSPEECLDEHLLQFENGETQYDLGTTRGKVNLRLELPEYITCTHCFLQWKWNGGNNWGAEPNKPGCVGCGPQEQFYGCSDISIHSLTGEEPKTDVPPASTAAPSTAAPIEEDLPIIVDNEGVQKICKAIGAWAGQASIDAWCEVNCANNYCPSSHCHCVVVVPKEPTTVRKPSTTEAPIPLAANTTTSPASNYTSPPVSNYTSPPTFNETSPPVSNETSPPVSNYTTPPPSNYTSPPVSNYTSPPVTNYTSPPVSNYTSPPVSNYTSPPVTNYTNPPVTNYTSPPTSNETSPPVSKKQAHLSNYTTPPPSNYTSPPVSNYTSPPVTNYTNPPVSNYTSPPTSNETSPPVSNETSPPVSNYTTTPASNQTSPSTAPPSTTPTEQRECFAAKAYAEQPGMNEWCAINCANNYCPESHCACSGDSPTTTTSTPSVPPKFQCFAAGAYKRVPGLGQWCLTVCSQSNWCPRTHCNCYIA